MLPTGELVVLNALPEDTYVTYQCRVAHRLTGETRVSARPARITMTEPRAATPPQLSERSLSLDARRDEWVVIPCVAVGHPPPDYRWEFKGVPLAEDEQRYFLVGPLLVLPRVRAQDAGRYSCVASNVAGSARLDATLVVTTPLSARVSPAQVTAALGQAAVFTCSPAGSPVTHVYWTKDGQPPSARVVPEAGQVGSPVLRIASVSREDQGVYQCFVKNDVDSVHASAELRLGDTPPQLVSGFIRQTIQPGISVSLKCIASGNPTPNIRWTLDGFPLPQADRFVIGQYVPAHGNVISHVNITGVRVEDGGTYRCTAANRVGDVHHQAQLNVYGPPHARPMGEISAVAGETLSISCPAAGYPIDEIRWFRDGPSGERALPTMRRHVVFPNGTLVVQKVQSGGDGDGGHYRCTVTNKQGRSASSSAHVNVMVPPTWVVVPSDKETRLGQAALLDCQVEGFPQPSVTWKKAATDDPGQYQDVVGTELPRAVMGLGGADDGALDALDGGASPRGMTILANGSLVLERVRQEDAGRYLCEASNGIGVGLSAVVTLVVHSPVHFAARSRKELARRGQTVTLSCSALGDLPITLTWRRGGAPIESGGRFSIRNSSLSSGVRLGLRSELLVQGLQSDDGGLYTCFGRNEYGYDQTQISLLVQDVPGAVGNLRLVEQTSRTASVAWAPPQDGNSVITRYLVRYRLVPGEDVDGWEEAVTESAAGGGLGGGGAVVEVAVEAPLQSAQLSALRPASLYAVTVLAENSLGVGPSSKRLAVPTDQEPPAAAPTHLAVEASSSTQLTVKWEAPAADSWHGPLLGHYVGHRELGRDPEGKRQYTFATVPWEGAGAAGSTTTVLAGLSKYKQYGVVVQAYNPKGAGPLSTEVVAQTLEDVPEAAPRDVHCSPESPESLRVHWQPPPEALVHGVIQGYRLLYQPVQDQLDVAETQNKMTTELSSTLHGLFKYTNYSVQVLAFTRVGDGNMSAPIFCRTKEDVPGQPGGVKAVLQAPDMALVTWLPPAHPNGQLTKYSVYVRDLEGGRQVDARNNPVPAQPVEPQGSGQPQGAPLVFRLPGMRKKHRYEFWVTAHTRVGEGQSSAVVAITPSVNVSNNIPPGAPFAVSTLSPATEYRLRVTAHNEAGSTQAEYLAATLDAHGGGGGGQLRHGQGQGPALVATTTDQRPHPPFHQDVKMVALTGVSVAALVLSFLALLLCLRKTRGGGSGTSPVNSALGGVVGGGQTATQDNKHNLARREQYYATTRKLPPSPSPATLECIPEYADDIRPYATFHVPGSAESTKLQTFTYRERGGEVASSPVRRVSTARPRRRQRETERD
ncbi:cell adhesion molecule Dscam2-like [Frankliniella occidentalis]|uniref:Cell adhesion molecule Dscam2-like n=1 Tax=Frankliniella occidentalis TaxID=133901 RepID=A0A9C6WZH4_FRAOC|nr:cell adhesion molecule Dscam2-like [Frankliniella occidentalis]